MQLLSSSHESRFAMSFKPYLAVGTVAAMLCACTSIQPTYTSSGNPGYRINCGGVFGDGDLGGCYQSAGETCQNQGFRIVQSGVSSMIVECKTDGSITREATQTNAR